MHGSDLDAFYNLPVGIGSRPKNPDGDVLSRWIKLPEWTHKLTEAESAHLRQHPTAKDPAKVRNLQQDQAASTSLDNHDDSAGQQPSGTNKRSKISHAATEDQSSVICPKLKMDYDIMVRQAYISRAIQIIETKNLTSICHLLYCKF